MVDRDYDKTVQLLTKAQDLGPFTQVPELTTISLVRHLCFLSVLLTFLEDFWLEVQ